MGAIIGAACLAGDKSFGAGLWISDHYGIEFTIEAAVSGAGRASSRGAVFDEGAGRES